MATFFTSDLHVGHANILKYCNRPFSSVGEMNEGLVARWNSVVGLTDEVWIVGDLCMGRLEESLALVKRLHGHKTLVPGNHDRMFGLEGEKRQRAQERYRSEAWIDVIAAEQFVARFPDGRPFMVSHFPYQGDSKEKEGTHDRYADRRPADRGMTLLHGHVHDVWLKRGRMINVGVDAWGGYPVPVEELAALARVEGDLPPMTWEEKFPQSA